MRKRVFVFALWMGVIMIGNSQTTNVFPSDGNVGIGITTPNKKFHVNGALGIGKFADPSTTAGISINYVDGGSGTTTFYHRRWGANIYFERSSSDGDRKQFYFGGSGTQRMYIYGDSNDVKIRFDAGGGHSFLNGSGNFGVGVTSPIEKLDINGNLNMRIGEGFKIIGDTHYFGTNLDGIIFQMEDTNSSNGATDGGFVFRGHTPTDGVSKEWMVVKSNGNVGIGTTTPDAKLAVNGTIHTTEVKVDLNGWPDYVFYKDYNLPTLQEVENHIKQNGHLQNIPSAKEVKEKGVFLGEMNAKLLQKIEELTLYAIAQEKKIAAQEKRLKKLEILLVGK